MLKLSNIRDLYYKYDMQSDTVWLLYEIYNPEENYNELILKRNYKSANGYKVETEILFSNLQKKILKIVLNFIQRNMSPLRLLVYK